MEEEEVAREKKLEFNLEIIEINFLNFKIFLQGGGMLLIYRNARNVFLKNILEGRWTEKVDELKRTGFAIN